MRRAVVATTPPRPPTLLERAGQAGRRPPPTASRRRVVFMMPGGGAQYAGMGRELYDERAGLPRRRSTTAPTPCGAAGGVDLLAALFPDGDLDEATATPRGARRSRCPALFATEYAMARLLESWGIAPAAMIGHSAGEYAAACLSGVVIDGGRAGARRPARPAVRDAAEGGDAQRAAVRGRAARRAARRASASPRSTPPDLCVASGPVALVDELEAPLAADDIDCDPRPHRRRRPLVDARADPRRVRRVLPDASRSTPPTIPYVSNLTGTWITAADVTDPDYWVRHLRSAVRFRDGIDTILADPNRVLLEIGPGRTLAGLARHGAGPAGRRRRRRCATRRRTASDVAFALGAVGRAWEAGVELDAGDAVRRRGAPPRAAADLPVRAPALLGRARRRRRTAGRRRRACCASGRLVDDWFSTPSWRRSIAAPLAERPAPLAGRDHRRRRIRWPPRSPPASRGTPPRSSSVVLGDRFQRASPAAASRSTRRAPTTGSTLVEALARRRRAARHDRARHRRSVRRVAAGASGWRPTTTSSPIDDDRRARPRQHAVPRPGPVGDLRAGAPGARHERRPRPRLDRSAAARAGAAARRRAG